MGVLGPHVGSVVQCATCGVEHVEPIGTCAICADERQWVPAAGQAWTSLRELREAGHRVVFEELENGLLGLTVEPIVGIGQQSHLVSTPQGSVLWDVPPFLDRPAVDRVRSTARCSRSSRATPHVRRPERLEPRTRTGSDPRLRTTARLGTAPGLGDHAAGATATRSRLG